MLFLPAYPIQGSAMRPVTKTSILGIRLGIVVLMAYWLTICLGTHLPSSVGLGIGAVHVSDKTKHLTAFFGLGLMLCYVTTSTHLWRRFLAIGAVGMIYAAVDEATQRFIPGRVPDVMDFVADSVGLIAAIVLYVVARHFFRSTIYPSES